tara:strand:- start:114 stop:1055 length:942 start_codon:yes stop_codon:yes gene_type:complete
MKSSTPLLRNSDDNNNHDSNDNDLFSTTPNTYNCFCGCYNIESDWIFCNLCMKYRHTSCCGYENVNALDMPNYFVCYACITTQLVTLPDNSDCRPLGGSLIVIPATLISQWQDQFDYHMDNNKRLKVIIYQSQTKTQIKKSGHSNTKLLASNYYTTSHPFHLIGHDIVITTFESLSYELNTTISKFIGSNINRKYEILPSPIIGIRWKRIIFDEAQEVEGNVKSKIVQMVQKLKADHKWFVSGTPLGTGNISDLRNIMTLLNQAPYNQEVRWKEVCCIITNNNDLNNSQGMPLRMYLFMAHLKAILMHVILRR